MPEYSIKAYELQSKLMKFPNLEDDFGCLFFYKDIYSMVSMLPVIVQYRTMATIYATFIERNGSHIIYSTYVSGARFLFIFAKAMLELS